MNGRLRVGGRVSAAAAGVEDERAYYRCLCVCQRRAALAGVADGCVRGLVGLDQAARVLEGEDSQVYAGTLRGLLSEQRASTEGADRQIAGPGGRRNGQGRI